MRTIQLPPKLGVGFSYHPGATTHLLDQPRLVQFCELSPDVLCREQTIDGRTELRIVDKLLNEALPTLRSRPLVVHGLGLSIGSQHGWNESYLAMLDLVHSKCPFAWHSEHLAFLTADEENGAQLHAGVPLPLPQMGSVIDMLAPRVGALHERYGVPFLLENLTHYLSDLPSSPAWDEVEFLNALTQRTDCGLLLDLYNFYCNAQNFGFDPWRALERLDMTRVVEIHVAGGTQFQGLWMDVHSRVVPDEVWALLDWTVQRTPNLSGVVYEVLEEALPHLGVETVRGELTRCQQSWNAHQNAASQPRKAQHKPPRPAEENVSLQLDCDALRLLQRAMVQQVHCTASPRTTQRQPVDLQTFPSSVREWVGAVPESKGFQATAYIARWWRETKIQRVAPLTVRALSMNGLVQVVSDYLDQEVGETLFYFPEGLAFLGFVQSRTDLPAVTRALSRFEQAYLREQAKRTSTQEEAAGDGSEVVVLFPAPPDEVLGAVLMGTALPQPDGYQYAVRVSAALPGGFAFGPRAADLGDHELPPGAHQRTLSCRRRMPLPSSCAPVVSGLVQRFAP